MKKITVLFTIILFCAGGVRAVTSTTLNLAGGWSYAFSGQTSVSFSGWGHLNITANMTDGFDVKDYKSITLNFASVNGTFRIATIGTVSSDTNASLQYAEVTTTNTPGNITITFDSNSGSYSEYSSNTYDANSTTKIPRVDLIDWSADAGSIVITSVVLTDNSDNITTMTYENKWDEYVSAPATAVFSAWGVMGKDTWNTTLASYTLQRFTVNFSEAVSDGLRFIVYTPDGDDVDTNDDETYQAITSGATSASVDIDYTYNNICLNNNSSSANTVKISSVTRTVYSITSLWSTGQEATNWTNIESLRTDNKGALANAKVGDEIRITYDNVTNLSDNIIQISNGHTYEALSSRAILNPITTSGTFCYVLGAEDVERIHESGIVVSIKNLTMSKIELLTNEGNPTLNYSPIKITSAGVATYNSSHALDFTGKDLKAYVASSASTGTVTMTRVYKVPANTGLYLIGDKADYEIPYLDGAADDMGTNLLVATNLWKSKVYESMDNEYRYILASNSGSIGFYKVTSSGLSNTETETGTYNGKKYHTLAAHRAYLQTTSDITPTNNAPIMLLFGDGETTGINSVQESGAKVHDGCYYNLSGQRVAQPTKGLYIVNGRKVVIK